MIDDTNSTNNYHRYHIRNIHATVRELSPVRKRTLLEQIQDQKIMHIFLGKEYNHQDCERIEKLLTKAEGK